MLHTDAAIQLMEIAESIDMARAERLAHMEALIARVACDAVGAHREDQRRTKAIQDSRKQKGRAE